MLGSSARRAQRRLNTALDPAMAILAFPLSSGASDELAHSCPVCDAAIGATFAFISGGALDDAAIQSEQSTGFLSIGVHGSHSGNLSEPSAQLNIFADSPLGQFEQGFCSLTCLRTFLNAAVDQLQARLSVAGVV